jgi:hypothetical protein
MKDSKIKALDLMIEDLHEKHVYIRLQSKYIGCEEELDLIKEDILNYLNNKRKQITN